MRAAIRFWREGTFIAAAGFAAFHRAAGFYAGPPRSVLGGYLDGFAVSLDPVHAALAAAAAATAALLWRSLPPRR